MATRTSNTYLGSTYQGTRRGRDAFGGFDQSMFPEKYESSDVVEDDDALYHDRRDTLSDFAPEQSALFASEEVRRRTYATQRLNLMQAGTPGSPTEPWISHGDFEISFTDQDPRGTTNEQNWKEYRRQQEANFRRIDFKNDGDFSEPSLGISPFEMYKNIRSAQNWVKDRMKIFSTSYESRHNGGVGVYDHVSGVFKSDQEDSSVQTDGDSGMAQTFDDPENRQHHTTKLSNIVHMGSAALRANSTTDHRVKVSAYGKLYSQAGLIPHETQLRLTEDDTPISRLDGLKSTPKNLVKLMSSYVRQADYAGGNFGDGTGARAAGYSAVSGQRAMWQDTGGDKEKFSGMRGDSEDSENRSVALTKDILSLMGLTHAEVKWAESYERENQAQPMPLLANMYALAEVVHRMPAQMKIDLKSDLVLRSVGRGLRPTGDMRVVRDAVVVNPKIIIRMESATRKGRNPDDLRVALDNTEADPVGHRRPMATPLMVFKGKTRDAEDVGANARQTEAVPQGRGSATARQRSSAPVAQYTHLSMAAREIENNRRRGNQAGQTLIDPPNVNRQGQRRNVQDDFYRAMVSSELDVQFPESRALNRHVRPIGSKNMRRGMTTDHSDRADTEIGPGRTKNPQNAIY
jgi:hypothetical protein